MGVFSNWTNRNLKKNISESVLVIDFHMSDGQYFIWNTTKAIRTKSKCFSTLQLPLYAEFRTSQAQHFLDFFRKKIHITIKLEVFNKDCTTEKGSEKKLATDIKAEQKLDSLIETLARKTFD